MIHRLYPIINIQAVVCTNTPSNHGGSPGRRIIFKLGSVVAAVPPPSRRSLPLLPGRPGPGPEGPHREKGVQPPAPAHRLQRAKPQPRPHRSPAGDGVLSAFGSCPLPPPPPALPGALPAEPPAGLGGRRGERQPRRRYFYSSPDLCAARPLPCRALPSGSISPLPGAAGAAGGPLFTFSCPAGPPARPPPPPAGPGPCARGSAPQQPLCPRGRGRGGVGGETGPGDGRHGTQARRKQTKWPRYASGRGGRGSSQPACPPPAAGLAVPPRIPHFGSPGQGPCLQPVPPRPPRGARRCACPTELCPGPGRQAGLLRWRPAREERVVVCLSLPLVLLSAPSGERGPEGRRHLRSFAEQSKRKPERFVIRLYKKDSGA